MKVSQGNAYVETLATLQSRLSPAMLADCFKSAIIASMEHSRPTSELQGPHSIWTLTRADAPPTKPISQ